MVTILAAGAGYGARVSIGIGRERQFEIYVGGARGAYPRVPVSDERLQAAARRRMSPEGYAYVAGGAGTEETMRENRAAFERWRIVPRMLRDVSVRDTTVEILGTRLPSPFVLCPIGVLEMAHRDADVAVAKAAAAEGIPFVFSNQASRPMEETASAMGDAPRQLDLLLEALHVGRVVLEQVRPQHLEGHDVVQLLVVGAVDDAHAALPSVASIS